MIPVAPSWVQITLDLTPPVLDLLVLDRATPPQELSVLLSSSSPMAAVSATFTDSLGVASPLGCWLPDDYTAQMSLPTVGLSSGPGILSAAVVDQAGNPAYISRTVRIDWASAFDVATGVDGVFDLDASPTGAFDVDTDQSTLFDLISEVATADA